LGVYKRQSAASSSKTAAIFTTIKRMAGDTEMNIKLMLIEKERTEYVAGNTGMAAFLGSVLDYVIELEENINQRDKSIEMLGEKIVDMRRSKK
jgi:hypothetical protein